MALTRMSDTEYDTDFVAWAETQARALRAHAAGGNAPVDWENVAEEIESLGRSDRRQLASHVATIIEHLIYLQTASAPGARDGWKETVSRVRDEIADPLLAESPSLRAGLDEIVRKQHAPARRNAARKFALHGEVPNMPVEGIAFSPAQVLEDWWPPD